MNYCIAQHEYENVPLICTWQTFSSAEMKDGSNQQLLIVCGNLTHERHLNELVVRAVIHLKWLLQICFVKLVENSKGCIRLQAGLLVSARFLLLVFTSYNKKLQYLKNKRQYSRCIHKCTIWSFCAIYILYLKCAKSLLLC